MEWRTLHSQDAENRGSVSMHTHIEFGKIIPAKNGLGFFRYISVIETDSVSHERIVVEGLIHGETMDELKIIDFENTKEE